MGNELNGQVLAIELDQTATDSQVLVGGEFTSVGAVSVGYIARLNENGALDPRINFGAGANAPIRSIDTHINDSVIAVAGEFTSFDGVPRNRYALTVGGENNAPGNISLLADSYIVNEDTNNTEIGVTANGDVLTSASVDIELFGPNNDLTITAVDKGAALNNVKVIFGDDGTISDKSATAVYTAFNSTLAINIDSASDGTIADTVITAITDTVVEFDAARNVASELGGNTVRESFRSAPVRSPCAASAGFRGRSPSISKRRSLRPSP